MGFRELPMSYLSVEDLGGGTSFGKNERIRITIPHIKPLYNLALNPRPSVAVISETTFPNNSVLAGERSSLVVHAEYNPQTRTNSQVISLITNFAPSYTAEKKFERFSPEEIKAVQKNLEEQKDPHYKITTLPIEYIGGYNATYTHIKPRKGTGAEYYFKVGLSEEPDGKKIELRLLGYYKKNKQSAVELRIGVESEKDFDSLLRAYSTMYRYFVKAMFEIKKAEIPDIQVEFSFSQS